MGRADIARKGPLEPASWPLWVLSFPEPWISPDKVKQAARMVRFRQWQRDRTDWFADHDLEVNLRVCNEEHRRRKTA